MSERVLAFPAVSCRAVNAAPLGVWTSWPSGWREQRRHRAATKRPRSADFCSFTSPGLSTVRSSTAGLRGLMRDSATQLGIAPCRRMELEKRTSGRDCAETTRGSSGHGEWSETLTQDRPRPFNPRTQKVDWVGSLEMVEVAVCKMFCWILVLSHWVCLSLPPRLEGLKHFSAIFLPLWWEISAGLNGVDWKRRMWMEKTKNNNKLRGAKTAVSVSYLASLPGQGFCSDVPQGMEPQTSTFWIRVWEDLPPGLWMWLVILHWHW